MSSRERVSTTDLHPGDVWHLRDGKRVTVLDEPFIYGRRWVAVDDHDFDGDPSILPVDRFDGGLRL